MDLWSISFVIENQFKNLFSEYVEDFEGYLSSSLFNNTKKNTKNVLPIIIKNNLGEFHQNEFWTLEVLVQKKPDNNLVEMRLNSLARRLRVNNYYTSNLTSKNKLNTKKVSIKKIIKKNWLNINRQSFPVINIERFYIYGSHIRKNCSVYKIPIKINASTAFGTGSHATTKCCLQAINYLSKRFSPNKILDYGCGTGILGIASKKVFKKSKVIFVDIDENAVKLSKKNIKLNHIKVNGVYLTNSFFNIKYIENNYYDLIYANILFMPLFKLAPVFKQILKPNSFLILSGLLKQQIPYIINRYNNFGFIEEKKIISEDWGSVIMSIKS
ncbi:50S ribosomal protein L11 methyltransferase [Alphaproteobacteria bacterium]|nr:50S ribosomal protein L11 methyltransferase [Alphaproteobacteria bacterium]